uniref:Uncharacterized protein n=1 Tax=Amazona collaria TaxID=241587 RepID=A0A8B9IZ57_9PSIT
MSYWFSACGEAEDGGGGAMEGSSAAAPFSLSQQFNVADLIVITAYFSLNTAVGIWASHRVNRNTASAYFLAGRDMVRWPVDGCLPLWSSGGSGLFMGLPGTGAARGIAVSGFEWNVRAVLALIPLFFPWFGGERIWMHRFGLGCHLPQPLCFLFHAQTDLYSGALSVQVCLGWDLYLSIVLALVVMELYTIAGRLLSVCWSLGDLYLMGFTFPALYSFPFVITPPPSPIRKGISLSISKTWWVLQDFGFKQIPSQAFSCPQGLS